MFKLVSRAGKLVANMNIKLVMNTNVLLVILKMTVLMLRALVLKASTTKKQLMLPMEAVTTKKELLHLSTSKSMSLFLKVALRFPNLISNMVFVVFL